MTRNVVGISSVIPVTGVIGIGMQDLFDYLQTIPSNQKSVHDIHSSLHVLDIYKAIFIQSKLQ